MLNLTTKKEKIFKLIIIVLYIVGGIGIIFSPFSSAFTKLTPVILVLSFIILLMFHNEKSNRSSLILFFLIYFMSFIIEVIGVNTGIIFGEYKYGDTLGFKMFNTPVIIGLNWLLLTYLASSIMENFDLGRFLKIFTASVLMLLYDVVLENVAPKLNMWEFNNSIVPIKNYISWFIIAIIFNTMIQFSRVSTSNKLSLTIFVSQLIFLTSIMIMMK